MNGKHFLDWFENKLVPALPNPSVIVLDNAPYHNIRTDASIYPTTNTNKDGILTWLQDRGVHADNTMLKSELLHLIKLNKPPVIYRTDEIAEQNGHLVLRLPVKHCELNPIELIQAEEKIYVAARNKTFKLKDVRNLFLEAKASITRTSWQKAEQHVISKVESYFWEYDGVMEEEIPPFIINLTDDEDSDHDGNDDNADFLTDKDDDMVEDRLVGPAGDATDSMDIDEDSDADSDEETVCKTCGRRDPTTDKRHNVDWILCDLCNHWFYLICVKMPKRKLDQDNFWCQNCLEKLYRK